jgi:hypothetical protein
LEVEFDGKSHSVATPLACSEDERRIVAVRTALLPFDWDGEPFHELQFAIVVDDLDADEAFEIFNRDTARGYVPEDARSLILDCVCAAVRVLVDEVKPASIYRVTKAIRPPEKALHKHELITQTLHECGYGITERGTDGFNREFWVLDRERRN